MNVTTRTAQDFLKFGWSHTFTIGNEIEDSEYGWGIQRKLDANIYVG
jgi:hypothetical protein